MTKTKNLTIQTPNLNQNYLEPQIFLHCIAFTFDCICPVWVICTNIFSTILAFSGLANAIVFTVKKIVFNIQITKLLHTFTGITVQSLTFKKKIIY